MSESSLTLKEIKWKKYRRLLCLMFMFDFHNVIAKVLFFLTIIIYIYHCIVCFYFSVLQQSLSMSSFFYMFIQVCLIYVGDDRWGIGTCPQLSMNFYIICIDGCHLFALNDSKWYSLMHFFVPNLTHFFFQIGLICYQI